MKPLNFKFYKRNKAELSSLCPWIVMADEGIVKLKGEALTCAYEFIAPDIASASLGKINTISNMFNNAMIQLGANWTIQFELQRSQSNFYPGSCFDNFTGYLIDRERELNFTYQKNHYKNRYFLIFTYFLPRQVEAKVKHFVMKSNNTDEDKDFKNLQNEIKNFKMHTHKVASVLGSIMYVKKLNSNELLELIHSSVSLEWHKMVYPEDHHILMIM